MATWEGRLLLAVIVFYSLARECEARGGRGGGRSSYGRRGRFGGGKDKGELAGIIIGCMFGGTIALWFIALCCYLMYKHSYGKVNTSAEQAGPTDIQAEDGNPSCGVQADPTSPTLQPLDTITSTSTTSLYDNRPPSHPSRALNADVPPPPYDSIVSWKGDTRPSSSGPVRDLQHQPHTVRPSAPYYSPEAAKFFHPPV